MFVRNLVLFFQIAKSAAINIDMFVERIAGVLGAEIASSGHKCVKAVPESVETVMLVARSRALGKGDQR